MSPRDRSRAAAVLTLACTALGSGSASRAIDFLETLDLVDAKRIGMMGHSYGGHGTIFAAALDPRIACAVSNGPVSEFPPARHPLGTASGRRRRGVHPRTTC